MSFCYSPYTIEELETIRNRCLFRVNEKWMPEESRALKKMADGASELIDLIRACDIRKKLDPSI